jgi:aspartate racemase
MNCFLSAPPVVAITILIYTMADSSLFDAVRASILAQRNTPPIERADRSQLLPASFAQQRLWFMEQLDKASAQHNLCVAFQISGTLNIDAMQQGLNTMVQRHESLRTSFNWEVDQLWQIVSPITASAIVMTQDTETTDTDIERLAKQEASLAFDITHPPLLRCKLIGINERDHVLLLTFHHLVFDGWSFEIFMRELGVIYDAFNVGQPSPLSELAVQYADFAVWQRKWLKGQVLEDLQAYWLEKMSNPPAPLMISSIPRNLAARGCGDCLGFQLAPDLSTACKQFANNEGLTVFMFLLAAFNALLFRLSGETDIIVGVPIANRNRKELEGLIGLLVNTLPLRSSLRADMSIRDLMTQVRQTVLEAYKHQDFLFETLIEALRLPRRIDRPPLVQTMFSYLNVPKTEWTLSGLTIKARNVHNGRSRFDLNLSMWEEDGRLGGEIEFDCELFDKPAIEALLEQWRTLLGGIIADPDCRIDALPLLTTAQTQQILSLATGATPDYPRDTAIHRVFETIVSKHSDKIALNYGTVTLTYYELNIHANQLAHCMIQQGITHGDLVAVCLPASPDFIIAILAILKLGGAFLPIEHSEPAARIEAALRGASVSAIISHEELSSDVLSLTTRIFRLDQLLEELRQYPIDNLAVTVNATDRAYVMFTSGSTGDAKAVCIAHRGVVRLACAANYAKLGVDEVMLLLAPLAFDASTFEIWGALLKGARLVIPTIKRSSLSDIATLISQQGVTTLWLSSGLFEVMMDAKATALVGLRQLLVGGDVLSRTHAERYLTLNPNGHLINCYGPTENTTFSTFHVVRKEDTGSAIPIGRPLNHGAIYVLDEHRKLLPFGVIGDAWLSGDGLMLGYLNNPNANASSLYKNPFSPVPDQLMYYTGDRVTLYADGNVAFIERKDRQLKIRGYRVEPCEIETLLMTDVRVAKACVVADMKVRTIDTQLIAYLVLSAGHETSDYQLLSDLRMLLQANLPEPLRPTSIVFLPELPLDNNGKLNRAALCGELKPLSNNEPPQDEMEQKIADVFGDILKREAIGRHDSFFEIGGHSLFALLLLARLEAQFDIKLPVVSLFEHGTPASMAAYIRVRDIPPITPVENVVELRRGSTSPALFMVSGGRGGMVEMILYTRVMRYLSHDMAVFGLLADDKRPLPSSVSEMAATYITRIKKLQPQSPYIIAGECVGGVIAYEIAQQLHHNGEMVTLLLFDSWCPTIVRQLQYLWRDKLPQRMEKPLAALKYFFDALIRQVHERPRDHWKRTLQHFYCIAKMQILIVRDWHAHIAQMRANAALGDNYIWQTMRYRPLECDFPVKLIVSEQNKQIGLIHAWQRLAHKDLPTWVISGTHETYLRETPKACAQAVNACLEQLLNDTGGHHESS